MENFKRTAVLYGVGGMIGAITLYTSYRFYTKFFKSTLRIKGWKLVGVVSGLNIHPIKSCHRIQVNEAECNPLGISDGEFQDRSFMVVNESNNFLHARIHPEMVLIQVSKEKNDVTLAAPDMESVTFTIPTSGSNTEVKIVRVWGQEVSSYDCGDEVAHWLSKYLLKKDSGARLVYYPFSYSPRTVKVKEGLPWMRKTDGAIFSDLSPFHLQSVATIKDLNSRMDAHNSVSPFNFRPAIIVSGCKPYEEDEWRYVKIGEEVILRFIKQCDRCVLTTVDPQTGIKNPEMEPLKTLKKYRTVSDPKQKSLFGESPLLGIDLSLVSAGKIKVGDPVYAAQL